MAELIDGEYTPGELLIMVRRELAQLEQEKKKLVHRLEIISARLESLHKSIPIIEGYQQEER